MTIGQVAERAGVGVETIRFYERQGLLETLPRPATGYRQYPDESVRRIRFVRKARELGFSLLQIRELLALRAQPSETTCRSIKQTVEAHVTDIDRKIRNLQRIRMTLMDLARDCGGPTAVAQCGVLESLDGANPDVQASKSL